MIPRRSGIVLAGGSSRRMGVDKGNLLLGGQPLTDRAASRLGAVASEVVVVGRTTPGFRSVLDELPGEGPLAAMLTGLRSTHHPCVIVVGCDMPFLDARLLEYLAEALAEHDAVVPVVDGRTEPLHAAYHRRIQPALEQLLEGGERRLRRLLEELDVRWVDHTEIDLVDPEHRSFINVNTAEEWQRIIGQRTTE